MALGETHSGFKATAKINRFDYNLKWSKTREAEGLIAIKDVDIILNPDLKNHMTNGKIDVLFTAVVFFPCFICFFKIKYYPVYTIPKSCRRWAIVKYMAEV
jgi:hypothetical protein